MGQAKIVMNRYQFQGTLIETKDNVELHRALDLKTRETVIVKTFFPPRRENGLHEESLLVQLQGQGVVRLLDVCHQDDTRHLILEEMESDLFDLTEKGRLSLAEKDAVAKQVISRVALLHHHKIIHRDLKLENILVNRNPLEVKLCDFESAQRLGEPLSHYAGTPGYLAPECSHWSSATNEKTDIWALGVTLYILYMVGFPYHPNLMGANLLRHIQKHGIPYEKFPRPWLVPLLQQIFSLDPHQRPTALEALTRFHEGELFQAPPGRGEIREEFEVPLPPSLRTEHSNLLRNLSTGSSIDSDHRRFSVSSQRRTPAPSPMSIQSPSASPALSGVSQPRLISPVWKRLPPLAVKSDLDSPPPSPEK